MDRKNLRQHYYKPKHQVKLNALQKKRMFSFRFSKITICILLLAISVCSLFIYKMLFFPRIQLKGDTVVTIPYKKEYKEPGFLSSYHDQNLTEHVKVKGKVNSNKLGEYPIVYTVSYHGRTTTKTRIVKIVDDQSPKIEFTTDKNNLYICPNAKYSFDDYKAIDNYDGDITSAVKVKDHGKIMRYQVEDTFGNRTVVERNVVYKDIEKPKLVLDSPSTVVLMVGDKFSDSSYQVKDNCSSKVKVKITGDVDTSKAGEYQRVYKATDDSGNITKVVQKVVVMEPVKKGVIYLTFDDGPRSGTTDIILNVLKEKGVKATFFVTNGGPDDLIRRAYLEGHSIGLHTASHDYSVVYASLESYFNDLKLVSDRVEKITGQKSVLIRFPGGSSNTISRRYSVGIMSSLTKEVTNRGYRYYDWNIDSRDAEGGKYSADDIANFVINSLSHDRVNMVLMHDVKVATKDAVGKIIDYGLSHGYTFEAITPFTDMVTQRVNN